MTPEALESVYRQIRELDPYHPVSIVFMAPHRAADYVNAMDIAMVDPYPIPHAQPRVVGTAVDVINKTLSPNIPVWLIPQAFGGNEHWRSEPTAHELRVMTYLGIVKGTTRVQYFIRHSLSSFPKSPLHWNACSRVALEVAGAHTGITIHGT